MSQSSVIAASLLAGFVLYLAANDRLSTYAAVLWGNTKAPLPSSQVPPGGFPVPGAAPGAGGGAASSGPLGGLLGKFPDFFGGNSGGGGAIEGAATLLLESGAL